MLPKFSPIKIMTTTTSAPGILENAITKETLNIDEASHSETTKECSEEASIDRADSEYNTKWHIDEVEANELDDGDFYTVWKDIKIILRNNQDQFSTEHLLCDKSQPSIYNSINEVMQSIEGKLSPPDKEILLHYLLDMCIENVSDRYSEYTCSLIEEFDYDFDVKVRAI